MGFSNLALTDNLYVCIKEDMGIYLCTLQSGTERKCRPYLETMTPLFTLTRTALSVILSTSIPCQPDQHYAHNDYQS